MSKDPWGPNPVGTYENTVIYVPEEVKKSFEVYRSESKRVGWAYLRMTHHPSIRELDGVRSDLITPEQGALMLAQVAFGISKARDLSPDQVQLIQGKNSDLISRIHRSLKRE